MTAALGVGRWALGVGREGVGHGAWERGGAGSTTLGGGA